jgi:hypothetical protein
LGSFHILNLHTPLETERTFLEGSMVGQVYLLDEHKAAMYIPLVSSVSPPTLPMAVREIRGVIDKTQAGG